VQAVRRDDATHWNMSEERFSHENVTSPRKRDSRRKKFAPSSLRISRELFCILC
jgi:hypothetical protein